MKFNIALFGQGFKFLFVSSFFIFPLLCLPSISAHAEKDELVLHLKEGESAFVPGTEIKIVIKSVIDLTSSGCLGGPIGCSDRVTIEIQKGKKSVEVVLERAKTAEQKKRKIDQTSIHGKTVRLTSLNKKEVELVVEESLTGREDH